MNDQRVFVQFQNLVDGLMLWALGFGELVDLGGDNEGGHFCRFEHGEHFGIFGGGGVARVNELDDERSGGLSAR